MSFKTGYRKQIIDRLMFNIKLNRDTKIDSHMALEMLNAAWTKVTASVIAKCFPHASFVAANESSHGTNDLTSSSTC